MKESFREVLSTHFKAGTPIMTVNSDEEKRCLEEIEIAAWSSYDGVTIRLSKEQHDNLKQAARQVSSELLNLFKSEGSGGKATYNMRYDYDMLSRFTRTLDSQLDLAVDDVTRQALKVSYHSVLELLKLAVQVRPWDIVNGFPLVGKESTCAGSLDEALQAVEAERKNDVVFVFKDCHDLLNDPMDSSSRRRLRNMFEAEALTGSDAETRKHIIFLQPEWGIHRDLKNCVTLLDFSMPGEAQLEVEIDKTHASIDDPKKRCPQELRTGIVTALRGFTQVEAANALAYGISKHSGYKPEMISTIRRLQKAMFAKDRVLTLIDDDDIASTADVGGFENAIEFAEECKVCFGPEAKKIGLRRPRGCLLVGVPGTGKSLFGKVLARIMELPLIIYDVAAQFGSLVGETEIATKRALEQIRAKGPAVVLIDEADKLFSGMVGSNNDSGVSMRMLGRILSFMANDNDETFVVMTMNRTLGVPPELLRAGRLDKLFYATFPTERERLDIIGIHLRKNGANIDEYGKEDLDDLVKFTDKYTGAELEQVVIQAVRSAFKARRQLTPKVSELLAAKKAVTPVANLDADGVAHLDAFGKERAQPVSKEEVASKVFTPRAGPRQIRTGPSNN